MGLLNKNLGLQEPTCSAAEDHLGSEDHLAEWLDLHLSFILANYWHLRLTFTTC